jgi:hypothetical protein
MSSGIYNSLFFNCTGDSIVRFGLQKRNGSSALIHSSDMRETAGRFCLIDSRRSALVLDIVYFVGNSYPTDCVVRFVPGRLVVQQVSFDIGEPITQFVGNWRKESQRMPMVFLQRRPECPTAGSGCGITQSDSVATASVDFLESFGLDTKPVPPTFFWGNDTPGSDGVDQRDSKI